MSGRPLTHKQEAKVAEALRIIAESPESKDLVESIIIAECDLVDRLWLTSEGLKEDYPNANNDKICIEPREANDRLVRKFGLTEEFLCGLKKRLEG